VKYFTVSLQQGMHDKQEHHQWLDPCCSWGRAAAHTYLIVITAAEASCSQPQGYLSAQAKHFCIRFQVLHNITIIRSNLTN
jgi:hypothetical protein